MAAATWQLPPELPPAVPDCVRAQVEHMLVNGAAAGLQISPVPGSLPPLLQPGARRVDAPPFQLDFELCMQKLRCQVRTCFDTRPGSGHVLIRRLECREAELGAQG